jgi:hypothetical protein
LEKELLNDQIEKSINNSLDQVISQMNPSERTELGMFVDSHVTIGLKNKLRKTNASASINNKWLFRTIILTNAALFVIAFTVMILLRYNCNQCIDIPHLLLVNGMSFILIGAFEYFFFRSVGLKYVPVMPSTVGRVFTEELSKKI